MVFLSVVVMMHETMVLLVRRIRRNDNLNYWYVLLPVPNNRCLICEDIFTDNKISEHARVHLKEHNLLLAFL